MWQWVLGLHIIGIILWIGGLMQVTLHLGHRAKHNDTSDTFSSYERKAYFGGILPGELIVIVTGSLMLMYKLGDASLYFNPDLGWGATFHLKMTLVLITMILTEIAMWKMRAYHKGKDVSRGTFMALHGSAALLLIAIVFTIKVNILGP